MRLRLPRSTRTDTLFPYTTLCRSMGRASARLSFLNVLIPQQTMLEVLEHELVDQRSQDGDDQDIGHHARHVGDLAGISQRTAQALAKADHHFGRDQSENGSASRRERGGREVYSCGIDVQVQNK